MIYPQNFEQKIGFDEIRHLLKENCLSTLGKEKVEQMTFSTDGNEVKLWLSQVKEFRHLLQADTEPFPLHDFHDVRQSLARIRLENTHLDAIECFHLMLSLQTIHEIKLYLNRKEGETKFLYPTLQSLTVNIDTFPDAVRQIGQVVDQHGNIKDNASKALSEIRSQLKQTEGSITRILNSILRAAQADGIVGKDVTPTLRDGRLVIPVIPAMKRKINGIVHDESASGRTLFIEPSQVVEANNRIRELEAEERKEEIRILTELSNALRPDAKAMICSFSLLSEIDFIQAKSHRAEQLHSIEPQLVNHPHLDWIKAVHPLLRISLEKQQKQVVPLDIMLNRDQRLLIISGPNAGGKSVCLKTVGLLQYMLQCGLSIPIEERSIAGIFEHIMIDIGDEQSIENDLSTYSSHLLNMKQMMRTANGNTLLLIDEFGSGTEPQIGGAIAEAMLRQFCKKKAFGVITTHYHNLKHFAEENKGVVNGAMLYDRHEMRALFKLSIGQPGSSFAIEIARKTGIPEEVIKDASELVGSEYIQSDKYLQDIVRDKRYWENKRDAIHQHEKDIQRTIHRYEESVAEIEQKRKEILQRAKIQAEELLQETNKRIENTIREIRQQQAEKEETRRIRENLNKFKDELSDIDTKQSDELIERKIKQIQLRKERRQKRKEKKLEQQQTTSPTPKEKITNTDEQIISVGSSVRIKGQSSIGTVEAVKGKNATVLLGGMHTTLPLSRLEPSGEKPVEKLTRIEQWQQDAVRVSKETRETIDNMRRDFSQDIDLRGMRGDDALTAVQYFIDDAILVGTPRVRILHGKGNGILRQLIRQYLSTVPAVSHFADEHVQFGGAGITVVDLE